MKELDLYERSLIGRGRREVRTEIEPQIAAKDLEIAGLKRQRDELHETTTRYLERARDAENVLARTFKIDGEVISLHEFYDRCDAGSIVVFSVEATKPQRTPTLWEELCTIVWALTKPRKPR